MVQRMDVEFPVEGDVALGGWLFVPDGAGPHPGVTMAHGFAGVKEHGLERFARLFAGQVHLDFRRHPHDSQQHYRTYNRLHWSLLRITIAPASTNAGQTT